MQHTTKHMVQKPMYSQFMDCPSQRLMLEYYKALENVEPL